MDMTAPNAGTAPDKTADGAPPRIVWPDLLRIVAVIGVIMLHTSGVGYFVFKDQARSFNWQICSFYNSVVRFCVPVFVMVSGMFLLDPARKYGIGKLYFSKIARIAAAFFFWSALYALSYMYPAFFGRGILRVGTWRNFAEAVFEGYYHMWFLFMIAGLYMVAPFLRLIARDDRLTRYFIVLGVVFFLGRNTLTIYPGSPRFCTALGTALDRFKVTMTAGYACYFMWGCYLAKRELSARTRTAVYLLGALGAAATVAGNGIASWRLAQVGTWMSNELSLNVFLMSTAVFVFFRYRFGGTDGRTAPRRGAKLISLLGRWSFGIYLAHVFFLEHMYAIGLPHFFCSPVWSVLITATIVFFASLATVFCVDRIPGLRKYVL